MKGVEGVKGLFGAEAGFVAGAALLGGPPALADRLVAEDGHGCSAALQALAALPREERSRQIAALLDEVSAPIPRGLDRVHAGWLREALEEEATTVLRALVVGLPAVVREVAAQIISARGEDPTRGPADSISDQALVDLRRAVFGRFVPLPPEIPPVSLDALATEGAAVLGRSLQGAPREVVARAAAGVGEPWARQVIEAAGQGAAVGRKEARDLIAAIRPEDAGLGAVYAIGLHALGAKLAAANEEVCLAAAQQLPPALGRVLIRARDRARGID